MPRNPANGVYDEPPAFTLGVSQEIRSGSDLRIIACCVMAARALDAANALASEGIDCRVINTSTIKPIDSAAICKEAQQTGAIVTVEEHSIVGASAVQLPRFLSRPSLRRWSAWASRIGC